MLEFLNEYMREVGTQLAPIKPSRWRCIWRCMRRVSYLWWRIRYWAAGLICPEILEDD